MDLATVVVDLMGAITIDGARTRLEYGDHKGLALAYSKGHKLTISRKGEKLTTDDVTAVRQAITAVTGQEDVKQSQPYQKRFITASHLSGRIFRSGIFSTCRPRHERS